MEQNTQFALENAAYEEKIALAKLEESKAAERVSELEYERARFQMQWLQLVAKEQEAVVKLETMPAPKSEPVRYGPGGGYHEPPKTGK